MHLKKHIKRKSSSSIKKRGKNGKQSPEGFRFQNNNKLRVVLPPLVLRKKYHHKYCCQHWELAKGFLRGFTCNALLCLQRPTVHRFWSVRACNQCCRAMSFWCGYGSESGYRQSKYTAQDPAPFPKLILFSKKIRNFIHFDAAPVPAQTILN
jgi:hypothetical protein